MTPSDGRRGRSDRRLRGGLAARGAVRARALLAGLLLVSLAGVHALVAGPARADPSPQERAATVSVSVPASRHATRVAVVPVTGAIDDVTFWSLQRRLAAARAQGFDAVALELDTPGGEVGATIDITLLLRSDAPANTVAWVHPKAFSAGTFLALACREIVVSPGAVFGDAAPITAMPGLGLTPLPAAERAKLESPLLDDLDAAAARRGDDPRLLAAFVAVERELWLIERASDGARRFASRDELATLALDAPENAKPATSAGRGRPPQLPADLPLSGDDLGAWRVVETVDTATRLLVAQSDEALRWGLAVAEVRDDTELAAFFGAPFVTRFPESWTEPLVRFLMSWPVRILLIAIFIVALVIEGLHPGIGVAGAVAAGALLLLVGAPGLLGLAQWWEILLVLAGIALVGVEVLVLPGTGVVGIAGALCIVAGLVASFTGDDPTNAAQRGTLLTAAATTIAGLLVGALGTWFASRWFRETTIFRRAVLVASVVDGHEDPKRSTTALPAPGAAGVADTDLRPSGRAQFGGELFDAQSSGDYIPRGTPIVATGRAGATVLVERAADAIRS